MLNYILRGMTCLYSCAWKATGQTGGVRVLLGFSEIKLFLYNRIESEVFAVPEYDAKIKIQCKVQCSDQRF